MAASSNGGATTESNALDSALRLVDVSLSRAPRERLMSAIGKDKSQISRILSGEAGCALTDAIRLLHAAGLKVVPEDVTVVDKTTYEAVAKCVFKAMSDPDIFHRVMMGK